METYERELLDILIEMMNEGKKIINKFPLNYEPDDTIGKDLTSFDPMDMFKSSKDDPIPEDEERKRQAELEENIIKIANTFPDKMVDVYIKCSLIVSHCLYITAEKNPQYKFNTLSSDSRKDELMKAMMIAQSGFNLDLVVGSDSFLNPPLPFKQIVTTFLGPEAINWITAQSQDFPGKVQPHETSRVNWYKLGQMDAQIKIEKELYELGKLEPILSKIVVASLWTMKGLASLMNPNIFIAEQKPHVSSMSNGNLTVSTGLETHFIYNYIPHSFIKVIEALELMLNSALIESHDMMWVATNLAELRSINSRHTKIQVDKEKRLELFLSHRGRDSKSKLMNEMLKNGVNNIFLDCLSLPIKLINRNFVFKNLVKSKKILIVRTENFDDSEWCRKEMEVAEILNKIGHSSFQIYSHIEPAITEIINVPKEKNLKKDPNEEIKETNWTIARILRDINSFYGEKPNIFTLKEKKLKVDCFDEVQSFFGGILHPDNGIEHNSHRSSNKIHQIDKLFEAMFSFLSEEYRKGNNYSYLKEQILVDYLAVTAQFVIALLSDGSSEYDKMVTRKYMNTTNSICSKILDLANTGEPSKSQEKIILELTKFMCSAIALELSGKDHESIIGNGILDIINDYGIYRDGLILLDVRKNLTIDNPFLLLLVEMVFKNNIGTAGILQSAVHPIHESYVNGFNLEVMPCVTFHSGMEALFQKNLK